MNEHPVLARVALGYSPMVDRQRTVIATRITVFPERPDAVPDLAALFAAIADVWPVPEAQPLSLNLRPLDPQAVKARAAAQTLQPLSLNLAGEALLTAAMAEPPPPHLMLEVPAFIAADPAHRGALQALHAGGRVLLIKGRPLAELPREVLGLFSHSVVDAEEDRRGPAPVPPPQRSVSTVQSGIRTWAQVEAAFARGAIATLGWPLDDDFKPAPGRAVPQDVSVVLELMNGVDREEPVNRLEAIVRKDPTLAFRLMRYLNSPAFGLSVEINSFGHALMMLGHQRLKRWLALLLASSSKDAAAKPLMHAAVRRGLLMEELARPSGDAEMRGEIFICGVFSLLDRLLKQRFEDLFKSVPVPERVRQALLAEEGPFMPFLQLVQAIENESLLDIREGTERLFMTPLEVNRAILAALAAARQLD